MIDRRRIEGIYPDHEEFAFRLLLCLKKVCGTLPQSEVEEWFAYRGAGRAVRRFKRAVFRVYLKMHVSKSVQERLGEKSYRIRFRFIRRVRHHLCAAWTEPFVYALYREVVNNGFDREAFIAWWNDLRSTDRHLIIDTWAEQIKKSVAEMWIAGLDKDAQICVRMTFTDVQAIRIF